MSAPLLQITKAAKKIRSQLPVGCRHHRHKMTIHTPAVLQSARARRVASQTESSSHTRSLDFAIAAVEPVTGQLQLDIRAEVAQSIVCEPKVGRDSRRIVIESVL
jgi:hypothetical protein